MRNLVSLCCGAPVRAVGDTTQHYVCGECREPCDWAPLTRHADHDPELSCRPALGAGLCYPVPASEQLIPWREALSSDGGER
jgi:hypothetical protein